MILRLLLLTLSAVSFLASTPSFARTKQLNWIGHWKDGEKRAELVSEVKKEFEFLHPDVRVNFLYDVDITTEGENYKWRTANLIVDMIQSGNITWDVVFLDIAVYDHVAELLNDPFWGSKHLVDFSSVQGFLQTQKDILNKDPFFIKQTGGIFTGPFIEGIIYCFWFNRNVAKKTGITVTQQGMKVEDLIAYARQLAEYNRTNNTAIPLIWLGAWNRLDSLFEYLFRSRFANPSAAIDESFNEEKKKAFLDTLLLFEKLGTFQPALNSDHKALQWDEWKNGFLNGRGLFITAGSFMYSHFQSSDVFQKNQVQPAEYPVVNKPNGIVGIYTPTFAVMKNSPNRKAAIDLMMLWSEPKIAEKWVRYTRNTTGIKGNLDEPVFKAMTDDEYSRFVTDMTERFHDLPMRYFQRPSYAFGEENPVSATEFRENLARILEGKLTATEYFNDIMRRYKQKNK